MPNNSFEWVEWENLWLKFCSHLCDSVCIFFQIQIWLAMAYEANRRHTDCIALYKELESSHPMINIRRQAAELRYILEAPKLKISNDEVVTIPQIGSSWDWLVIYFRLCSFTSPSLCHFALELLSVYVGIHLLVPYIIPPKSWRSSSCSPCMKELCRLRKAR